MKKGFTLLELLIATSIFAIVMLITTTTFSWASSYNNKLGEMRKTSLTAKKTMEMISKDIRQANGQFRISDIGSPPDDQNIGQLTLMDCPISKNKCGSLENKDNYIEISNTLNGLLIFQKDSRRLIIYRSLNENNNHYLYRKEINISASDISKNISETQINTSSGDWTKINHDISMEIKFWGYTANKETIKQQPHVFFRLTAQTLNYDSVRAPFRAKTELRTAVTSRDYN